MINVWNLIRFHYEVESRYYHNSKVFIFARRDTKIVPLYPPCMYKYIYKYYVYVWNMNHFIFISVRVCEFKK